MRVRKWVRVRNSVVKKWLLAGLTTLSVSALADDAHKDFLNHIESVRQSDMNRATHLLEERLKSFPEWHLGRLELARLYYQQDRFSESRSAVKMVVKEAELPDAVKKNILAFYKKVLEEEKKSQDGRSNSDWLFEGKLLLGGGYDTNANTGPADQDIGLERYRLKKSATGQEDSFFTSQLALAVNKGFPGLSDNEGVGYTEWSSGLHLFSREYQETNEVSLLGAKLSSELTHRFTPGLKAGIEAELQRIDYAGDNIRYLALEPGLYWNHEKHKVRLGYLFRDRYYFDSQQSRKNGHYHSPSIRYSYRFAPELLASSELSYINTDYSGPQYNYHAIQTDNRLYYLLQDNLMLWGQARYRFRDYNDAEYSLYKTSRDERYLTLRLGAKYQISPDLETELIWAQYHNDANQKLYEYKRQQVEFKLTWKFLGAQ